MQPLGTRWLSLQQDSRKDDLAVRCPPPCFQILLSVSWCKFYCSRLGWQAGNVNHTGRRSRYFSPFSSVDLNKMAADFSCTVPELEVELTELIAADIIQARIDSDKQILYARQVRSQRNYCPARLLAAGRSLIVLFASYTHTYAHRHTRPHTAWLVNLRALTLTSRGWRIGEHPSADVPQGDRGGDGIQDSHPGSAATSSDAQGQHARRQPVWAARPGRTSSGYG